MAQDKVICSEAAIRIQDALHKAERLLPPEIEESIEKARICEGSPSGRLVLGAIAENLRISRETGLPMCQDTGMFWCLASVGRDSTVPMRRIEEAVNEGCLRAATEGYLRKSVVEDPVYSRVNTKTNLPVVMSWELVEGSAVTLSFLLKGFGSENCSSVRMLNPTAGEKGVRDAVLEMMRKAGGKPCPPVFLGVGIGGTMDRAALLSKKAFFQEGDRSLSAAIMQDVNTLGIGPGGLGGSQTCLGVSVLAEATHIAGLPVALTVNCWAERKAVVVFKEGEL